MLRQMATQEYTKNILKDVTKQLLLVLCGELRSFLKNEIMAARKYRKIKRRRVTRRYNRYEALVKELNITEHANYKNRLPDAKFEELLKIIYSKIQKQDTVMREALPARVKLKTVMHHLTTGDNFHTLSELHQVPKNSISQFLPSVCSAISEGLQEFSQALFQTPIPLCSTWGLDPVPLDLHGTFLSIILLNRKVPQTKQDWQKIQHRFEAKWNFATCCGAIDGCHISVRCAKSLPQTSVMFMCIVDDEYKIIYYDVQKHENIEENVDFAKTSLLNVHQQLDVPKDGVFVANSNFPLTDQILTPYDSKNLTPSQDVFNYRLERVSRIAENALGLLQSKFRVFERPCSLKVETIEIVLQALCALHNWLINTSSYLGPGSVDFEDIPSGTIIPGEWRQNSSHKKLNFVKNTSTQSAIFKRHTYASRFIVKDILPWQWTMARVEPITF